MSEILQPGVNVAITSGPTEVSAQPQKVLFVGQMIDTGTATFGELNVNIQNNTASDALFGERSMLAEMLRNARDINPNTQFDAIGVDKGTSAIPAVYSIAIAGGTSTDAGELSITVGSKRNHTVSLEIGSGLTDAQVVTAIVAALATDTSSQFVASESGNKVLLFAQNAGTYGNSFGIDIEGTIPGQSIVVYQSTIGSIDPDLTAVFDVVADRRYQTIVWPYPDDVDPLTEFLDPRFNASNEVLDGVGITPAIGTASSLVSAYASENSQSLVVIGDALTDDHPINEITNGDFTSDSDWTKGTGWTISGGTATKAAGVASALDQGFSFAALTAYFLEYTVSAYSAGSVTPNIGATDGTAVTANGTFTELIITGAGPVPGDANGLSFDADATFAGSIDNVRVYRQTVNTIDSFINVPSIFEIPVTVASIVSAIRAIRYTEDVNIVQFLSGAVALDAFGGPALASRPYFNTPVSVLPIAAAGAHFTKNEIEDLFDAGVMVLGNNRSANGIVFGEAITTYKTNAAGNPDLTFKFLNYVDTSSAIREFIYNNLSSRFSQSRLTDGDLTPGRPGANEALIQATLIEFYSTLSGPDFSLTQAGEAALQSFINGLTVSIDTISGTATILMASVPIVTQLRQINAVLTIVFSPTNT